ncbi:signal-regulatory protein beta-2-like [Mugil cephalus]|uniref:signal-regulatory protein beta-2-like n=1 Tax=Mugil cephalus TaxID=48193 RepID=UPI001FB80E91|nr:signal-regulatory protein beta-2-like [Mugil cephalus]
MMVFIANIFLLCVLCGAQMNEISQPEALQTLNLGDTATIKCYINSVLTNRVWYKLTIKRRLQLVATFNSDYNYTTFTDERYSLKTNALNMHLIISRTSWDNVGTYFCGVVLLDDIKFGSGTFLMLKGTKMISDSVVQLPQSQSVQSGDSLTLSCSVHTECTAEHMSVMWLKNSGHSAPEMIYSAGNNSSACQPTASGETTCVYNLFMRNISSDDAGVYYCVVTSCGQMLLGNGTKLAFESNPDTGLGSIVIALMLSNVILGIATFILAWTLCRTQMKDYLAADGSAEGSQTSGELTYAAVNSSSRHVAQRQSAVKHRGDSVIYSNIRYCHQDGGAPYWEYGQTRENEED